MYWQVIRQYCSSVAEYLERYYPGDKKSRSFLSLYQMAKSVDAALQEAFARGGDDGVNEYLSTSNSAEICLNSIGVEWNILLHGDAAAAASQLAAKPPGMSDLLPPAVVQAGLDVSKSLHRQAERVGGKTPSYGSNMLQQASSWLGGAVPSQNKAPSKPTQPRRRNKAPAQGKAGSG